MTSPWMKIDLDEGTITFSTPDADPDFTIGDVVLMRGQGQMMTVEDVCACGSVDVIWFAGNEDDGWTGPHRDTFDADMLVNLDDDAV